MESENKLSQYILQFNLGCVKKLKTKPRGVTNLTINEGGDTKTKMG